MHYQSNTSIYFKVDRLINTSVIPITAKFKKEKKLNIVLTAMYFNSPKSVFLRSWLSRTLGT